LPVAQISVTHGLHPDVSAAPAVQIACAHVPALPELELAAALELLAAELLEPAAELELLAAELLVDMLPPQLTTGTHARVATPSAVLMGVHAVPVGHAPPVLQSVAQYVSPSN
jgi:hypothetical protein